MFTLRGGILLALCLAPVSGAFAQAWSPDGKHIAFWFFADNEEVYVVRADGSHRLQLTHHPEMDFGAEWSPDGRWLAFASKRDGNEDLYRMRPDGSEMQRLTDNPADDSDGHWSPDGRRLVFNSRRDGNSNIFVMQVDGSGLRRLTDHPKRDFAPRFSPDGTQIVFVSDRAGDDEIFLMNADGSGIRQLTRMPGTFEFHPAWSPDGKKITFVSKKGREGDADIWIVNADGSGARNITRSPSSDEFAPHWSPDGTRLSFARYVEGQPPELCVISLHDLQVKVITRGLSAPDVSPQDGLDAFFAYYLRDGGLWRQDSEVQTGDEGTPIAYIKGYAWGPGRAMVYDDTYALLRDGSCKPWVHIVHVWDREKKVSRAHIFHSAGIFLTAEAKALSEMLREAEVRGALPNGTEVRMRDRTDISNPRRAVVTASTWDGKQWAPGRTVSWVRITAEANPCRLPATPVFSTTAQDATFQRDEFRDPRDGQLYPTVEIGGMTWFAKNLNYPTRESYCYDNKPESCEEYGRLYRWEVSLAACPDGWHQSTDYEWQALEQAIGIPFAELAYRSNRGEKEGARLKKGGDTGFDTQYGGWRRYEDQVFQALDKNAAFWTSTETDLDHAWHRDIDTGDDMVYRSRVAKDYALSVRCVKNRAERDLSATESGAAPDY